MGPLRDSHLPDVLSAQRVVGVVQVRPPDGGALLRRLHPEGRRATFGQQNEEARTHSEELGEQGKVMRQAWSKFSKIGSARGLVRCRRASLFEPAGGDGGGLRRGKEVLSNTLCHTLH